MVFDKIRSRLLIFKKMKKVSLKYVHFQINQCVCVCVSVFSRGEVITIQSRKKNTSSKRLSVIIMLNLLVVFLFKNIFKSMPALPMTELPVCSLQLPLSTSMSFHENYNKTKQNPFKAVFHHSVHALPRSPKVLLLLLGPKNTSLGQNRKGNQT